MAEQEVVTAKPREGKFNKNAARRVRVAGHDSGRHLRRQGTRDRG